MKVLISIKDAAEAHAVVDAGGVDIVDIKNPSEGTLGANHPWVIEEIKNIIPRKTLTAASIGDLDFKPGSACLAAHGAASIGLDYVTASMFKVKTPSEVEIMAEKLSKTLEEFDTGLIIAGYVDFQRCRSISPFEFLPNISGAEYIMLDTAIKDGKNILDFVSPEDLMEFKKNAHGLGLKLIVSGSIRHAQLETIQELRPDVIGFRGIVCENGDVKKELVQNLTGRFK